jgi:hypothetical protein
MLSTTFSQSAYFSKLVNFFSVPFEVYKHLFLRFKIWEYHSESPDSHFIELLNIERDIVCDANCHGHFVPSCNRKIGERLLLHWVT